MALFCGPERWFDSIGITHRLPNRGQRRMHLQTMRTNRASRGATTSVLAVMLATAILLGLTGLPAFQVHAASFNAAQVFEGSSSSDNTTSTPTGNVTGTPTGNTTVVPVFVLRPPGNMTSTSSGNMTSTSSGNMTSTSSGNMTVYPVLVLQHSGSTTTSSRALLGGGLGYVAIGVAAVVIAALGAVVIIRQTRSHRK